MTTFSTFEDLVDAMSGLSDAADAASRHIRERMAPSASGMQKWLQAMAAHEREIRDWDQQSLWKEWR